MTEQEAYVPLGGAHEGIYGALFCRECKTFLGYGDMGYSLPKRCPKCDSMIDYEHKMRIENGEWKKVKK